jgi:hypothetical protein
MNAKTIDVLDIMRRDAVAGSELMTSAEYRESREAQFAVIELLNAGNAWCALMPGLAGGPEFDRLRAALARVGGAA